jgi:hypothetical protein
VNSGRAVFSQLIQHLPEKEFKKCVARHNGDSNFRGFSCWDQLLAMAFAQLTYRESLRDIEACLRALGSKLYHLGFRRKVSRSTLADANESHDWRIFAEFAQVLIGIARPLHAHDPIGVDLDQSLYALDSTTIDLCRSLFPWAKFRQRKAAVKMHTVLDLHGNIPTFIRVTSGDVHDVNILDEIMPEAGAFYVMDRGYIDFQRLFVFTLSSAFFVVRACLRFFTSTLYFDSLLPTSGPVLLLCAILRARQLRTKAQRWTQDVYEKGQSNTADDFPAHGAKFPGSTAGAESVIVGLTGVTVTEVVEGQIAGGGEIYRQLSFGRRNPVL